MGILSSIVSDVVRDTALIGLAGVADAHEKYRDKHPKKNKANKKSMMVQSPFDSSEYKGRQVQEVVSILKSQGFKNINTFPKYDLVFGLFAKEGDIESITINGRDEFGGLANFYENDPVNIIYHAHK